MEFLITGLIGDGLAEAPGYKIEIPFDPDVPDQARAIAQRLGRFVENEFGELEYSVGSSVTIERIS